MFPLSPTIGLFTVTVYHGIPVNARDKIKYLQLYPRGNPAEILAKQEEKCYNI
jgi:hypothetical protein